MIDSKPVKPNQVKGINNSETTHRRDEKISILRDLCWNNSEYFSRDSTENGQRLYISFLAMVDAMNNIKPKYTDIENKVQAFDFDEFTPGNGYRSFLYVVDLAIQLAITNAEKVLQKRDNLLFRKNTVTKDIEACSHLLTSIDGCLSELQTLLKWSECGDLFVEENSPLTDIFAQLGQINQHCFYGRNLGFQYCDSIKNLLQFISLSMTLFSEVYYSQGYTISKATTSAMSTAKFITDPEQRARRIVNLGQHAEVDFCKAFWFLSETELMNQLPAIVSPSVAISKVIHLPPEPLVIKKTDGEDFDVPVPSSFIGRKPVQVRLISHKVRSGMLGTKGKNSEAPSRGLMIHCHGGGFVAQSSKSHDGYLRDWAKELDIPILCIDYSLAPEAPFPRALEEVLYAYCWAINNCDFLGSTGEFIIGAGDSAGANLLLSTTLQCIKLKIPVMAGIFVAYVPTLVHYIPSPARLLCVMDPLIPFGFLMKCLKAYACPDPDMKQVSFNGDNSDTESFEEITESDLMELQAQRSPTSDDSDTLTFASLVSNEADNSNTIKQQYNELLDRFTMGSDTSEMDQPSTDSASLSDSLQRRFSSFLHNLKGSFSKYLVVGEKSASDAARLLDIDVDPQNTILDKFSFDVPKDPLLSPLFASDEDLKQFPPTRVLSVHMDPCLDDCIMFAKRLKKVGNDVTLDILSGLPHGFLNFSLFSKEAYEGSKVCIERIKELLTPKKC